VIAVGKLAEMRVRQRGIERTAQRGRAGQQRLAAPQFGAEDAHRRLARLQQGRGLSRRAGRIAHQHGVKGAMGLQLAHGCGDGSWIAAIGLDPDQLPAAVAHGIDHGGRGPLTIDAQRHQRSKAGDAQPLAWRTTRVIDWAGMVPMIKVSPPATV
jgi:hypothetical protein